MTTVGCTYFLITVILDIDQKHEVLCPCECWEKMFIVTWTDQCLTLIGPEPEQAGLWSCQDAAEEDRSDHRDMHRKCE